MKTDEIKKVTVDSCCEHHVGNGCFDVILSIYLIDDQEQLNACFYDYDTDYESDDQNYDTEKQAIEHETLNRCHFLDMLE